MSKAAEMERDNYLKKAMVHVLGCKVNQAEAAAMARILEEKGYSLESGPAEPDLIVINTCCVTSRAEGKSRRAVNRLAAQFPRARIIVTGCLAEVNPDSVKDLTADQLILGTSDKDRFHTSIDREVDNAPSAQRHRPDGFGDLGVALIPGRARAFLKVQDGCSQACTYCIVPRARGRSRSLPAERAVEYARELDRSGTAEIVLTGVHLGAYGRDLTPALSLDQLLKLLLESSLSPRFRLSSVEPQEISEPLIDMVTGNSRVCRHFHIPLQSGDDAILTRMGRPYDTSLIREIMARVAAKSSETCVGMDVMVGFPGEDEHSFRKTTNLIETLKPAYLHVFPYSPRPGTPAATFKPKVPEPVARRRVEELRKLSHSLRKAFIKRCMGGVFEAVPETVTGADDGTITARTDNYIKLKVELPADSRDRKVFSVRLEKIRDNEVWGTFL
jgi:threonylcarbamoyladenosine tRNA methylthiotransferase MtaB